MTIEQLRKLLAENPHPLLYNRKSDMCFVPNRIEYSDDGNRLFVYGGL